ncbi:VOC family protein [Gryllotalpicola ginsengisoli]|uniref:VOC family protein n=1 Tax=Gryllotalpicola ginsengisoli TaxID=444608 RepID=UPI0003B7A934|nr:VOC family protein [Gryllotalpicola ginsengisoli]
MFTAFGQITITVRDYDEAIDFYVGKLGFTLVSDTRPVPGIRIVKVAPAAGSETVVVFEKATTEEDWARLGKQFPGMTLTLFTDDIDETVARLKQNGVQLVEPVRKAPWGTQTVIADLYGNLFDVLQPAQLE